jgi:hypothetical protein
LHVAEVLGPYRLKVTVPVGVPVDTTSVFTAALSIVLAATVAVSHTDVPGGPPELGTVMVVVGVGQTAGPVRVRTPEAPLSVLSLG